MGNSTRESMRHRALAASLLLAAMVGGAQAGVIYSDSADTTVRPGEGIGGWEGTTAQDPSLAVGQVENVRQHAVLVFQLPDMGAVANPFATASLGVRVYARSGSGSTAITVDADLVGLDRRSADPAVDITDDGIADDSDIDFGAPGAVLQTSYLTIGSAPYAVDGGESASLRDFLNNQYAGGAGANQFVFLRLSPQEPNVETGTTMGKYGAYWLDAGDAIDASAARPAITYTAAVPEPASIALLGVATLGLMHRRKR